jgi:lysophospholipase L1-like esterase
MRHSAKFLALACVAAMMGCNDSDDGGASRDFGDNDPDTVLCLGDSITTGRGASGGGYPGRLGGIVGKRVINAAVNGAQSADGASMAGGMMAAYNPGFVLILLGVNDLIHEVGADAIVGNLRSIVQQVKANSSVPILGTLTPMYESHEVFNDRIDDLNSRIRSMAGEEGADVANLNGAFGSKRELILSDGVHPSDEGHDVMATTFGAVIQ